MGRIIGLLGLIGSGKDTVSNILVNDYGFHQVAFADSLKEAVSIIFGWPLKMLDGKTKASRVWREQIDDWWSNRLGIPELTPRWVLQNWGTDVNRNMFHQDIWVASLERKLVDSKLDFVISDCRFINELKVLTNVNATLCRVDRGPLPEWHDTAVAVIKSGENIATDNRMSIDYPGVHISEWGWINTKVDYVIDNNFDLPYLKERIGEIIRDV